MRHACSLLVLAALVPFPSRADEEGEGKPFTGGIEVGYRDATVDGNEDKYREDVNLSGNAIRLFGADLAWRPSGGHGVDELTFEAQGLGGEPYASARIRARKAGRYDLSASYRTSEYFYRDAGYFFRDGGDLHAWDARRALYGVDLKVKAAPWLTLRMGADRAGRDGRSTTSRDLQREEFVLDRPVDQTDTRYRLGADLRFGWADLTLEQHLTSSESRSLATSAANDGLETGGARLDAYRQLEERNADIPVSRLVLAGRPRERLAFSIGYTRSDAELDYRVDGAWQGLDYDDSPAGSPPEPFQTTLTNTGKVERTTDIVTADVTVGLAEGFDLTFEAGRRSYDQDGTIDSLESQVGGKDAGDFVVAGTLHNELQLDTYGLTARWEATPRFSVSAGAGFQKRTAEIQIAGPTVETKRDVYRAGIRWRPTRIWDVRLDVERGSDDDPYTIVSPTDIDRVRADIRIHPTEGLQLGLRFKDESRENDLTYPLGLPTDDTPPATDVSKAAFDVTAYGATIGWARKERLDLSLGWDRVEIDSDADIVYVTGSTFVPAFDVFTHKDRTAYTATQDGLFARVQVTIAKHVALGASATRVRNDGTFPLDWNRYGAEARYRHGSGFTARLAYDRYELDETNPYAGDPTSPTPDVNDYAADLWTVALGYRF